MSEDPRHAKASNMEFDIPLSQAPPHRFKGDSKTGKEGRFLIENKEDFRHVSPDCRLLWVKLGEGQLEAKHPMLLLGVHACHSPLGPKLAARNEAEGCCHWSIVQLGASCYRVNAWLLGLFSERAICHHLSMIYSRLFSLAGLNTTGWESVFSFSIWVVIEHCIFILLVSQCESVEDKLLQIQHISSESQARAEMVSELYPAHQTGIFPIQWKCHVYLRTVHMG